MMKHAIDWFEIPTADLERACAFYEKIFEFKLQPMDLANRLRMAMFPVNPAESVGGALCHHPEFYTPSRTGTLGTSTDPTSGSCWAASRRRAERSWFRRRRSRRTTATWRSSSTARATAWPFIRAAEAR